ncbi:hypothetical protein J6590_089306 [Homalodisca vitripennis]|nr:hypothetical protein J6590_089306 [Homalodisca vitripennis]
MKKTKRNAPHHVLASPALAQPLPGSPPSPPSSPGSPPPGSPAALADGLTAWQREWVASFSPGMAWEVFLRSLGDLVACFHRSVTAWGRPSSSLVKQAEARAYST